MSMLVRIATEDDIAAMLRIRLEAKENILRSQLTYEMVSMEMRTNCQAWVALVDSQIVGFSIANRKNQSIWGLFVLSAFQGKGFGRALLIVATDWLWTIRVGFFRRRCQKIWLDTKQASQAEGFYRHMGWQRGENRPFDEVRYYLHRKQS